MQGSAQSDKIWNEYVNTIKDLLTESKEFVASITSNQDTLIREIQEECKQMKSLMAQNTKLMAMLESNISRKKEMAATNSPGSGKVKKQKRSCKKCKKDGCHEDTACFLFPEMLISAQIGRRNRMVCSLGVVTWR